MTTPQEKIGILLVNLGTPDAPKAKEVRTYLKEFLSDRRIVDLPAWRWKPILHGIILRTRPAKSAAKYASIWTDAGSPLLLHSRSLCDALKNDLEEHAPDVFSIQLGMRYGKPGVNDALDKLVRYGITKVLVIPMYPQFSSTTTASALDAVYAWATQQKYIPEFRFVNDYHDKMGYIDALSRQILEHWQINGCAEKLVISFHGVPQKLIDAGDPYHAQCMRTVQLMAQALKLKENQYITTFQSRFGSDQWLGPATQTTLENLAQQGVKSVDVICPGFSADCLETLEEINMECREAFIKHGGTHFQYIPCLNSDHLWVKVLARIINHHTRSWKD